MDFLSLGDVIETPFGARKANEDWQPGFISTEYLQEHFGHLDTATEMIEATISEGLKLFFQWLADKGKIPQ